MTYPRRYLPNRSSALRAMGLSCLLATHPEVAAGLYLIAAWLLGLPVLSWQVMGEERGNTMTGSILTKLRSTLPERVKKSRGKIDNDF